MLKKLFKGIGITLGSIIGLFALTIGGLNIAKFGIYKEFYKVREKGPKVPFMNKGFVAQGLASDDEGGYLHSGYTNKTNYGVIHHLDKNGDITTVTVNNKDNSRYVGHFGGIAKFNNFVYVVDDTVMGDYDVSHKLYVFNYSDINVDKKEVTLTLPDPITIEPSGSTVSIADGYMYIGEFYKEGKYATKDSHKITTPSGAKNTAFITAHKLDASLTNGFNIIPDFVISAPEMIQGFSMINDVAVTSTSWGVSDSHLRYYSLDRKTSLKTTIDGHEVPLHVIDESTLIKDLKVPAMSEGLFIKDNKVTFTQEAGGNKYMFGKLFGAFNINTVPMYMK